MGNDLTRCCSRGIAWYCYWDRSCFWPYFREAAALIYTAGQSAPALNWSDWNPLSISSPISIFRQAETLAVHIWKVNSEGTTPDATAVSAGSAAVLLIFILIFNFGARRLGAYLHKKLTSA